MTRQALLPTQGGWRLVLPALLCLLAGLCAQGRGAAQSPTLGSNVPLLQPTSVFYDSTGNLFFAESRNQVVRRLAVDGTLTTVAGSMVEGFGGDGGPATAAVLDDPHGVVVDGAGNLYIADTHNNRVRRVDGVTGAITTIAGSGAAGFSGDGGPATAARLREPIGLALDASQHLFVTDAGNERVRSIDLHTGVISTVCGSGRQGFAGDGGAATAASLNEPYGLAVDGAGDLLIGDAGSGRVREVSAVTRQIQTVAGGGVTAVGLRRPEGLGVDANGGILITDAGAQTVYRLNPATGTLTVVAGQGVQAFGGDQGAPTAAMLNAPAGVAVGPGGALAIADAGNARIRVIGAGGLIATVAGIGSKLAETVQLAVAGVQQYGSAAVTASVSSGTAVSGQAVLSISSQGQTQMLQAVLHNGVAVFDLSGLSAGTYQAVATQAGDGTHTAASSAMSAVTIQPLAVSLTSSAMNMVYGAPMPTLTAALSGVLPRDANAVGVNSVVTGAAAGVTLAPGVYPVRSTLTGAAAGNYVLSASASQLTVTKAPVRLSVSQGADSLNVSVASTTTGVPTGAITLLTSAGSTAASLPVGAGGSATVALSSLAAGTYQMLAVYSGDVDFLPAQSAQVSVTVGSSTPAGPTVDFALTSASATAVTAPAGGSATYALQVRPTGGALSSPVLLMVSGQPTGSTASFNPSLVPPGGTASVVTLTVQLPESTAQQSSGGGLAGVALALLGMLGLPGVVRGRSPGWRLLGIVALLGLPLWLSGCGERIAPTSTATTPPQNYTLVVTGTATQTSGAALVHSTTLTLTVP